MTDKFNSIKKDILDISKDIHSLFSKEILISEDTDYSFEGWRKICDSIQEQMSEEVIRFAVVGAIKSGKSTFVNSLLGGDYLRRGAGVVTSIVTRIRRGTAFKANMHFKSWDEINTDIEQALALFPQSDPPSESKHFDIRREKDRVGLQNTLNSLASEFVSENGTLNPNCVILSNYLDGYDTVQDTINAENKCVAFNDEKFSEHKAFVGNDALSVYLKDIELEINADILESNVEIADCQGSDSPNPLHMAMIQNYLALTHFIIYVVSSRTGLREADMRFLSMIKKMGILDNIIFIVNYDFDEHESIEDLNLLIKKIQQEISIITPDPQLFVFSALFDLFKRKKESLSPKDNDRLAHWSNRDDLARNSDRQKEMFLSIFFNKIIKDRFSLLLKNHLERLKVVITSAIHWITINKDIISGDLNNAFKFIEKINIHKEKVQHIKTMIRDTMDGSGQKIKNELKKETDHFFNNRSEKVVGDILEVIRNYHISGMDYEKTLETSGFNNALYIVFQDFKHEIDSFMAESINPQILKFIKDKEKRIADFIQSVSLPYEKLVLDTLDEYNDSVKQFGVLPVRMEQKGNETVDMELIKRISGLKLPSVEAVLRYSARIKTDAIIRFGVYNIFKLLRKAFKKPIEHQREDAIRALKDSVGQMKREMEKSIIYHFKNYKENIKFQYILKLVDYSSNYVNEQLDTRFDVYLNDLLKLTESVDNTGVAKEEAVTMLTKMHTAAAEIAQRIDHAKAQINDI